MKTPAFRYSNLFKYINKFQPKSIMEIGTWHGDHAKQMLEAALKYHPSIRYIGFDLFEHITDEEIECEQSKKVKAVFKEVSKKLMGIPGVDGELHVGHTKNTIPLCKAEYIDFIFIDGGHSKETIATDWNNIQKFIHKGTVILFDDYWVNRYDAGCASLIDDLRKNPSWNVAILDPVDVFPEKIIRMVRVIRKG